MLADELGLVWSRSPVNTAADFGTSLPFNQAEPLVYNMAAAVSAASIICAGNTRTIKQHRAERKADCAMGPITPTFLDFGNGKPVKGWRSMRLLVYMHSSVTIGKSGNRGAYEH